MSFASKRNILEEPRESLTYNSQFSREFVFYKTKRQQHLKNY